VAWGASSYGQLNVPALPPGVVYVEVACGDYFSVARRSDGSVVAWGSNESHQCNVPALPPGFVYVDLSAAWGRVVARYDRACGANAYCSAGTSSNGCVGT